MSSLRLFQVAMCGLDITKKISMVLNIDCFTCPGSALCKIMRSKIYNSKLKDELLLEFHARSDHQAKTAARAALRFNGKIQKLN